MSIRPAQGNPRPLASVLYDIWLTHPGPSRPARLRKVASRMADAPGADVYRPLILALAGRLERDRGGGG